MMPLTALATGTWPGSCEVLSFLGKGGWEKYTAPVTQVESRCCDKILPDGFAGCGSAAAGSSVSRRRTAPSPIAAPIPELTEPFRSHPCQSPRVFCRLCLRLACLFPLLYPPRRIL